MNKYIQLKRGALTTSDYPKKTYKLEIEIAQTEGISPYLFVNQRLIEAGETVDRFVATPSPAELTKFQIGPGANVSFYLTDKTTLVASHIDYLEEVYKEVEHRLMVLLGEMEALDLVANMAVSDISSSNVAVTTRPVITVPTRRIGAAVGDTLTFSVVP